MAAVNFDQTQASEGFISLSLEPGRTYVFSLYTWALLLFACCTVLLHDSAARVRTTFLVIVLSGVFQALYGSFMTLSGIEHIFFFEKEAYRGVATGTFINRNHLAGYLEMCLAIGVGLLVASLNEKQISGWRNRLRVFIDTLLGPKMRLRIYLALMVIALVLTRSRMGNTAFFISLGISGLLLMLLQRRLHKGAVILFVSMALVDLLIVGQWFGFKEVAERLENTSVATETRDEYVRDTLVMIQDYPLTGTGLDTYYATFPQYKGPEIIGFYHHGHNDYLEFFASVGLIGYIPLALMVICSLGVAIHTLYKRRDRLAKGVAFAATMGIISLMIHSSTDFNLQMPANALLFVVLLTFAWISRVLPRENT